MIYLGACLLLIALAIFAFVMDYDWEWLGMPALCAGGATFFLVLFIPIEHAETWTFLQQRDALEAAYQHADPISRASMAKDVAAWNGELAADQYWNHTQWDLWWPDAVDSVKPIEITK